CRKISAEESRLDRVAHLYAPGQRTDERHHKQEPANVRGNRIAGQPKHAHAPDSTMHHWFAGSKCDLPECKISPFRIQRTFDHVMITHRCATDRYEDICATVVCATDRASG